MRIHNYLRQSYYNINSYGALPQRYEIIIYIESQYPKYSYYFYLINLGCRVIGQQ